jgi:small subunit ribosomal protein S1
LTPDPWSTIPTRYKPGTLVRGKVTSITDFGVFLEIEEGIEGLIHVSELSKEKLDSPKNFTEIGNELEAVVLNIDTADRKIALSIKQLEDRKEKANMESYLGSQNNATSNLGMILQGAMERANKE